MGGVTVIDADTHLFETRDLWRTYCDPETREAALRLDDDELGWTWLMHGDRRLHVADRHRPGEVDEIGRDRRRLARGEAPARPYDETVDADYHDPAVRLRRLDEEGFDATVLFPNFGLLWERPLADDLPATQANMVAWNRWAADVATAGGGRLHPVAHLTLRDAEWFVAQLPFLAESGIRLAMIAPALVDGRRLSDPVHDRVWAACCDQGITPVFHVAAQRRPFEDAWYEEDADDVNPVMSSVFLWTAPAMAIADLAVHGVFDRLPDLRIGVFELSAVWLPLFLLNLDGGYDFHARFNGAPLSELTARPSEYVRRHVRVAAFSQERPDRLTEHVGDLFMACSDYPHAEGTATPLADYRRDCPRSSTPADAPGLFGGNVAWLLRQDAEVGTS